MLTKKYGLSPASYLILLKMSKDNSDDDFTQSKFGY